MRQTRRGKHRGIKYESKADGMLIAEALHFHRHTNESPAVAKALRHEYDSRIVQDDEVGRRTGNRAIGVRDHHSVNACASKLDFAQCQGVSVGTRDVITIQQIRSLVPPLVSQWR